MTRHAPPKSPLTPLFQRGEFLPFSKGGQEGFKLLEIIRLSFIFVRHVKKDAKNEKEYYGYAIVTEAFRSKGFVLIARLKR